MTALKIYTEFTSAHRIPYDRPTVSTVCAFMHFLTTRYNNPSTILNYLGGVTTSLMRIGVDISPFRSIDVADFVQSVKVNIRHVTDRKLPVSYHMLVSIVDYVYTDPQGPTVAFAITIMYFLFLRQSNIAPRNKAAFDHHRHLLRSDVILRNDSIVVALKWSKSRQGTVASSLAAPALPGAILCPCQAYRRMLQHAPTLKSPQALLCFKDCTPLPTSYLTKVWGKAMEHLGIPRTAYTLHSLRRGGATDASRLGASIQEIRQHGDWRSDAVYSYLPHDPAGSRVCQAFRESL